ncbi:MAG: hypothetical protein Q9215_002279 [Flavoplaca cf. flavocitrina]
MAVAYLRLNGTDAKEHAVFRELTRVKQYFQKIQDVEKIGSTRENLSLDKVAAGRMISHVLTLALSSALIDKAGGLESNGKNQQQSTGNSQVQHIPASEGMSAIVKSEYPTERASSGQNKHTSKKVKLEHNNSNDRKHNGEPTLALLQLKLTPRPGDEATSNLMANPAAHSPPSFTASEHTGTVGGSNMTGKRRKRKKHQPHDASKGPGDSA